MPCSDGNSPYAELREANAQCDYLTRLLCAICHYLENGRQGVWPVDVADWWRVHKKEDEERQRKETELIRRREVRRKALEKLTDEEKKELNLR